MINISEIEIIPVKAKNGLTFFASCVVDDKFYLGNIAVFTRLDGSGFRLVYPTKVLSNGKQIPVFYPIDNKVGQAIEDAISQKATKLYVPETYQVNEVKNE